LKTLGFLSLGTARRKSTKAIVADPSPFREVIFSGDGNKMVTENKKGLAYEAQPLDILGGGNQIRTGE